MGNSRAVFYILFTVAAWGMASLLFCPPAQAQDISIRYQIESGMVGSETATLRMKLEFTNRSGEDLKNLKIALMTPFTSSASPDLSVVGVVPGRKPLRTSVSLSIPDEYLPAGGENLLFYVLFDTPDQTNISAIIQGVPVPPGPEETP